MDDSKAKFMPTDSKLKRVEETNKQLSEELEQLKNKLAGLERSTGGKAVKPTDFMDDLSRVFDDDKSFLKPGAVIEDLWMSDIDADAEYDFRINLMEHDLQSIQAENNTLVQTVMRLKQEQRDRRSMHDEVSVKLIMQDMNELKRDIQTIDDRKAKIVTEIEQLRSKMSSGTINMNSTGTESVRDLKSTIDQLDQSNKVAFIQLYDLKDKNRAKRKAVNEERDSREMARRQAAQSVESENLLVGQLRNKVMSLTVKLKEVELQKARQMTDDKTGGEEITKENLMELRQNNERLMTEMLRLNAVIREQKAAEKSRLDQSLSMSAIQFNEQSFDKSFMSNFK